MTSYNTDHSNNRVYNTAVVNVDGLAEELEREGFEKVDEWMFRREVNDVVSGIHQFAFIV